MMTAPASANATRRRISFASCRTLPGHRYSTRYSIVSSAEAEVAFRYLLRRLREVMVREGGDLDAPLAQRRHVEADDVEAVEESLRGSGPARRGLSMSALVAAITRTSTRTGCDLADRVHLRSTRGSGGSFGCTSSVVSPISSRKRVPPAAPRMTPWKLSTAPVNAPRRWPKSCASSMSLGEALQLKGRKVARARFE
jgi:hypothetical protein